MKDFLLIDDGEIKLNSGLDEYMFGKTSYSSILSQPGFIFDGENFEQWNFTQVKSLEVSDKDSVQVFYTGTNPFKTEAKSLLDFYMTNDREIVFNAAFAVCKALTKAALQNINIPLSGAGGIIVENKKENAKVLFLPADLIKYSSNALSATDKANVYDCWVNETLKGLPATCFFRGNIAYTMLTGRFPYPAADALERNADILDKKFLPIEMLLPRLSPELSAAINKSLVLTSSAVNEPGKKQKGTSTEALKPEPDFPLELLKDSRNCIPTKEEQAQIDEQIQNYTKGRDAKITTKRIIRRNTAAILTICCGIIALCFVIKGAIKSHGEEFTTQSLTSTQTIQAFFMNVNDKDVAALGNFVKGRSATRYTDAVSQVFVLSKQRQSMTKDNGFAKPENYFLYVTDAHRNMSSGMYGMTNILIDGTPYELDITVPTINQKLPAIREENGHTLTKNEQTQHKVEYYRLRTEGDDNDIFLDYITDSITLTYNGQRWIITDFDTVEQELELDSTAFKLEYFKALQENDMNVINTISKMRFEYPWLPSEASIQREIERLEKAAQEFFVGL